MLDILRQVLDEARHSMAAEFLGRQRLFLHGLSAQSLEKSTLHLTAEVPAPSPSVFDRVTEKLAEEISRRLGVEIHVLIRAKPASRRGPSLMDPLVDSGNRTAYLLLDALASGDVKELNPVFVYGPAGTGKSHLLRWFQRRVGVPVSLWQGLEFHAAIVRARRRGGLLALRRSLVQSRLFVLDEVHRLRRKFKTQKELATLIDELRAREVQMLLVGRHHPNRIHDLDRPLASRFLGGFTVEIRPPLVTTRQRFVELLGLDCPRVDDEMRAMLQRAHSYGEIMRLAERIRRNGRGNGTPPSSAASDRDHIMRSAVERVADCFGVEAAELRRPDLHRRLSLPRHVAVFVALRSGVPAAEIARRIGWRAPSAVSYAVRRVEERMKRDTQFRRLVERCL